MCARFMKTVVVIHEFLAHSSDTLKCVCVFGYVYMHVFKWFLH